MMIIAFIIAGSINAFAMGVSNGVSETVGGAFYIGRTTDGQRGHVGVSVFIFVASKVVGSSDVGDLEFLENEIIAGLIEHLEQKSASQGPSCGHTSYWVPEGH